MEQLDWMARISTTIANEVRRTRQQRGMSAQKLADRCAELGAPIPRTVLSNLENGRRGNVTVAEWLVLAAALDVPPVTLVFPVGYEEAVEPLPGVASTPIDAAQWVDGRARPDGKRKDSDPDVALDRFRRQCKWADSLAGTLAHAMHLKLEDVRRQKTHAQMRVAMLQDRVGAETNRAFNLMAAAREERPEGRDVHAVQEQLRRYEVELADAEAALREADMQAALAASTVHQVVELVTRIRADREDMRARGWVLPELSGVVALALEKDDVEEWLNKEE